MTSKQEPLAAELLASDELDKFCKEFDLITEIDKLSSEYGHIVYRVADKDGNTIKSIVIKEENITEFEDNFEEHTGTLLNKVTQLYPK